MNFSALQILPLCNQHDDWLGSVVETNQYSDYDHGKSLQFHQMLIIAFGFTVHYSILHFHDHFH